MHSCSSELNDVTFCSIHVYKLEMCVHLAHWAAYSGNSLPTFWDNLQSFLGFEDVIDRVPRDVGKELPPYAE